MTDPRALIRDASGNVIPGMATLPIGEAIRVLSVQPVVTRRRRRTIQLAKVERADGSVVYTSLGNLAQRPAEPAPSPAPPAEPEPPEPRHPRSDPSAAGTRALLSLPLEQQLTSGEKIRVYDRNALVRDATGRVQREGRHKLRLKHNAIVDVVGIENNRAKVRGDVVLADGSTSRREVHTSMSNLKAMFRDNRALNGLTEHAPTDAIQSAPTGRVRGRRKKSYVNALTRLRNSHGALIDTASRALGVQKPALYALLMVESGATIDERKLKVELHHIKRQLSELLPASESAEVLRYFDQHFRVQAWNKQWYREQHGDNWIDLYKGTRQLGNQQRQQNAFHKFERDVGAMLGPDRAWLATEIAALGTSWDGPQIMGFNHRKIAYDGATQLKDAFDPGDGSSRDQRRSGAVAQMSGLLDFLQNRTGAIEALLRGDWNEVARLYNGSGQVQAYGNYLRQAEQAARAVLESEPTSR